MNISSICGGVVNASCLLGAIFLPGYLLTRLILVFRVALSGYLLNLSFLILLASPALFTSSTQVVTSIQSNIADFGPELVPSMIFSPTLFRMSFGSIVATYSLSALVQ